MPERIAFIHSYLSDNKRKDKSGDFIPDMPTRACIIAASELYRRNLADKIAFSVTYFLAKPMQKHLEFLNTNSLDKNDVISLDYTTTTAGEFQGIQKILQQNPDSTVTSICLSPHKRRVENNAKRIIGKDKRLEIKSFDEIFTDLRPNRFYNGLITESKKWKISKRFEIQEWLARYIEKIPRFGPWVVYEMPDKIPGRIKIGIQKWFLTR